MIAMTLTVTFESDWRVGTGAGVPGGLDRACIRDGDGLPYVPAKTVTGALRDAAEIVANGLDGPDGTGWADDVAAIFGDQPGLPNQTGEPVRPQRARLSLRAARLPSGLRATLGQEERGALRATLFGQRASVRLDDDGMAVDRHLRFDEVAAAGLAFHARAHLDASGIADEVTARWMALLTAAASFVDGIGAGRRRGLGRCTLAIDSTDAPAPGEDELLRLLSAEPDARPPAQQAPLETGADVGATEPSGEHLTLDVRINALSPLLIRPTVAGNVHRSLDHIPGGLVLPIVAAEIDALLGAGAALAALRSDALRVTAATPAIDDLPGRAMPLALARYKDGEGFAEDGGVLNRLAGEQPDPGRQLKGLRDGWVGRVGSDDALPELRELDRLERAHAVIDDAVQRPTESSGGLFTYEVLPEGTSFAGRVELRGSVAAAILEQRPFLDRTVAIGSSKKDDYGEAQLRWEPLSPDARPVADVPQGDSVTLWALSPVIVHDELDRQAPSADGLAAALTAALIDHGAPEELELKVCDDPGPALRPSRHESWNARWGLPRPSLCAIGAGSCLVLEVSQGTITAAAQRQVERWGVGDLRGEGFGQILLQDPLLEEPAQPRASVAAGADAGAVDAICLEGEDQSMLKRIENLAWRTEIGRAALVAAQDAARDSLRLDMLSRSQLGRLRSAASDPRGVVVGLRQLLEGATETDTERRLEQRGWPRELLGELREVLDDPPSRLLWGPLVAAQPLLDSSDLRLTSTPEALRTALREFALQATIDANVRVATADRQAS